MNKDSNAYRLGSLALIDLLSIIQKNMNNNCVRDSLTPGGYSCPYSNKPCYDCLCQFLQDTRTHIK